MTVSAIHISSGASGSGGHGVRLTASTSAAAYTTAGITCTVTPCTGTNCPLSGASGSKSASVQAQVQPVPPSVSVIYRQSGALNSTDAQTFIAGEGKVGIRILGMGFTTTCGSLSVSGQGVTIDTSAPGVCGTGQNISRWTPTEINAFVYIGANAVGSHPIAVQVGGQSAQGQLVVSAPPVVTISGEPGVPLNGAAQFDVQVNGGNGSPINFALTSSSAGSAVFDSTSSSTAMLTTSGKLTIRGLTGSSTANDVILSASIHGVALATPFQFSVVSVTISFKATPPPSQDNSASSQFLQAIGVGVYTTNGPNTPQECAVGVEFKGAVAPSNYAGSITLKRKFALVNAGELYTSSSTPFGLFGPGAQRQPGGDDTSFARLLVTTVTTNGNVFDLDAPGTALFDPSFPYRLRFNFIEYAVIGNLPNGVTGSGPQVSADFPWWAVVSCTQDNDGNLLIATDVPGDNSAGPGQIKITWNLQ